MKHNKVKKEIVEQEPKFIGNMIFHVGHESFDKAPTLVDISELGAYQKFLKWNFKNLVDGRLIRLVHLILLETEEIARSKTQTGSIGNIVVHPYKVIAAVSFLEDIDWWIDVFDNADPNTGHIIHDIDDHPFIEMTAANIFGEIVNRIFSYMGYFYTDVDMDEVVKFVIDKNYNDLITLLKGLLFQASQYVGVWNAVANILVEAQEEAEQYCEEKDTDCSHCSRCKCE